MEREQAAGQDRGRTGKVVGSHVRRARERMGIDLAALSQRLAFVGHPITKSALSRLENGLRRVDVDDLMALSVVLYTSPLELLLGENVEGMVVPTAAPEGMKAEEIWAWAAGETELALWDIVEWWSSRSSMLGSRLELLARYQEEQKSADARQRRAIEQEIRNVRRQWEQANRRIKELTADAEGQGIDFSQIPPDPTVTISFPQEQSAEDG